MDVAITGIGVISSIGQDHTAFHAKLAALETKIGPPPFAPRPELDGVWVSAIDDFEAERYMPPQVAAGTDTFAQYAIAASVDAVRDAGLEAPPDAEMTAVVLGTALSSVETVAASQRGLDAQGVDGIDRKFHIKAWPSMAAAQVALRWQLHGPLLTIATACASSLDAIGTAARMIATGQADFAIAGGADASMCELRVLSGGRYGMFKPEPDPITACRPFDRDRTGVILGEGAGVVFLERADLARARNARVHGMVRGYASLSDGFHVSSPDPTGAWQARTITRAITDAKLPAGRAQVDAVIAHGTGTKVGDGAEIRAINQAFGDHAKNIHVTSIKGHIGHSAGAAGAMGLIAGLKSMAHGALVPTAGTRHVDPEAKFQVAIGEPARRRLDTLLVNAFGFGGQNAALIVTRA
jgi:3-oxoacyl-[acyl-carrier-protein] synthase II